MNNLLFTALIIALLYYFFYYLPSQKQLADPHPPKLSHSIFTQTNPNPIKDSSELEELTTKHQALEQDYQAKIKAQASQITQLQTQIRDLAKRPLRPTNSKSTQTEAETELTKTLDNLIKEIQDFNNNL